MEWTPRYTRERPVMNKEEKMSTSSEIFKAMIFFD
jgi:hypothetical protein